MRTCFLESRRLKVWGQRQLKAAEGGSQVNESKSGSAEVKCLRFLC